MNTHAPRARPRSARRTGGRPASGARLGDLRAAARIITQLAAVTDLSDEQKRHMVADLCRLIDSRLRSQNVTAPSATPAAATRSVKLSPRMRQTLQQLLRGDSEKQAARALGVSPHTVHVYVKAIYRKFDVASRGELLARFVRA